MTFEYHTTPSRIVFGAGRRAGLPEELERLGVKRAFVLTTPGRSATAAQLARLAAARIVGVFEEARQHVPAAVVERAKSVTEAAAADGYVSLGGGSATGLAKALALGSGLPVLALPTTLAGSEVTPVWGITERDTKRTGRDQRVVPRTVIYDPELTLDLPPALAGASGMNAVAHCVEALYAPDANPVTSLHATEGIRVLRDALPRITAAPDAVEPRGAALYGALLAGLALAAVSMGPHHRLCHLLGGALDLPHAGTHAVLLPYVVARLEGSTPALNEVALMLGQPSAASAMRTLASRARAPLSLRELGLTPAGLERACELAEAAFAGETPLADGAARAILRAAYVGDDPGTAFSMAHGG